ncbi:globin domain-containing protein [Psychromarinibacter sp. S121]|uniref:globin domain-containing protein n=1 Tax=Psychromarinibacter sp. S121 TaxID=3415127 RepID=UPI003C7CD107
MLDPNDIKRIRTGFARLKCAPDELTRDFYGRLFRAAPAVRPLFPDDIRKQAGKLQKMLVLVVQTLDDLDTLIPEIRALGARHVGYGAADTHYPVVGEVLIETLAAHIPGWTDADRRAWTALYGLATAAALEGAEQARGTG